MADAAETALWAAALDDLVRWHDVGDRSAARRAVEFIEPELRLAMPRTVPRRWPAEQVEDALQSFLERLLSRPLPSGVPSNPAGYILRSFRNWCLDIERGRKRNSADPWDDDLAVGASQPRVDARDEAVRVGLALAELRVEDRVALKLEAAPETLTEEEWAWLAERAGLPGDVLQARVWGAPDTYALTLLYYPGSEPSDWKGRRDRMERFRKRRERARAALVRALGEVP